MTFYDQMQKIATKLLTKFDQGGMTYIALDEADGGRDPGPRARTYASIPGVARGVSQKYIDSGLAIAGDYQSTHPVTIFFAIGRPPKVGDLVNINGLEYPVKQALRIPPVGTTVAYRLIYGKSKNLN